MVKQLVGQRALGRPGVSLGVVHLEAIRVLDGVLAVEEAAARHVELVVDHRGAVVHPPLLQVLTLDKLVGFSVVGDHPSGVPWEMKADEVEDVLFVSGCVMFLFDCQMINNFKGNFFRKLTSNDVDLVLDDRRRGTDILHCPCFQTGPQVTRNVIHLLTQQRGTKPTLNQQAQENLSCNTGYCNGCL